MRRLLFVVVVLVWAHPALASNGALEINQTCALQTGCFSGDTPGFPVTISTTGSYLLTSSLDVPSGAAVEIMTAWTTLDLNGFSITNNGGVVTAGVVTSGRGIVVRNGAIRDFVGIGLELGEGARVDEMLVESCQGGGIQTGPASLVTRSRIGYNGEGGVVGGVSLGPGSGYSDLVLWQNEPTNITGGRALSPSLCDGAVCSSPGRRFYVTTTPAPAMLAEEPGQCAAGFHFASAYELRDPTGLVYEASLGVTTGDMGTGPPAAVEGWIRTGLGDELNGNCNIWDPVFSTEQVGATLRLALPYSGLAETPNFGPWVADTKVCSTSHRLWCIEN